MAYASLLYATREFLIDHLTIDNKKIDETVCNVMVDGRPPGLDGEFFISVHPGGFRGNSPEVLDVFHSLNITLTFRVARIPFDRVGELAVIDKALGIGDVAQTIIEYIHNNYQILHIANNHISEKNNVNKWVEPLRFASASPPRYVGGEWFHAEAGKEEAIIQTIGFSEARRVQFATFQPYPVDQSGLAEHVNNLPEHLMNDFIIPDGIQ